MLIVDGAVAEFSSALGVGQRSLRRRDRRHQCSNVVCVSLDLGLAAIATVVASSGSVSSGGASYT